jgi:hypothetical protein
MRDMNRSVGGPRRTGCQRLTDHALQATRRWTSARRSKSSSAPDTPQEHSAQPQGLSPRPTSRITTSRWTRRFRRLGSASSAGRVKVRHWADISEVAGLFPLHGGPVLDRVPCRRIDFLRRQEHHCTYARAPRLANGKCERGSTLVVRKVGDGEGVMVADGEVEVLKPSRNTLGGSGHGFASTASALPSESLDALHRVRRIKQEPWHNAPFCGRRLTVSPVANVLKVSGPTSSSQRLVDELQSNSLEGGSVIRRIDRIASEESRRITSRLKRVQT